MTSEERAALREEVRRLAADAHERVRQWGRPLDTIDGRYLSTADKYLLKSVGMCWEAKPCQS